MGDDARLINDHNVVQGIQNQIGNAYHKLVQIERTYDISPRFHPAEDTNLTVESARKHLTGVHLMEEAVEEVLEIPAGMIGTVADFKQRFPEYQRPKGERHVRTVVSARAWLMYASPAVRHSAERLRRWSTQGARGARDGNGGFQPYFGQCQQVSQDQD